MSSRSWVDVSSRRAHLYRAVLNEARQLRRSSRWSALASYVPQVSSTTSNSKLRNGNSSTDESFVTPGPPFAPEPKSAHKSGPQFWRQRMSTAAGTPSTYRIAGTSSNRPLTERPPTPDHAEDRRIQETWVDLSATRSQGPSGAKVLTILIVRTGQTGDRPATRWCCAKPSGSRERRTAPPTRRMAQESTRRHGRP